MKDEPWGQYPSWVDSWVQGGRRIPVVQANWATRYVGKIKVTFDKNGELTNFDGYPILLGGQGSENPESEDAAIKAEIKQCAAPPAIVTIAMTSPTCLSQPASWGAGPSLNK